MSGVGFTYPFAKRVSSATKWVEGQRGILEPEDPTAIDANKEILIRTTTTFPPGYTGAMAAQAEIVDRAEDGSIIASMPVWVKDINGGTLSPNTIYQARVGGTYTQDITVNGIVTPTTLGLYLVQAPIKETPIIAFRPVGTYNFGNGIIGIANWSSLSNPPVANFPFPPEIIGVVRLSPYSPFFDFGLYQNIKMVPYVGLLGKATNEQIFINSMGKKYTVYSPISGPSLNGIIYVDGYGLNSIDGSGPYYFGSVQVLNGTTPIGLIPQILDFVKPSEKKVRVQITFDLWQLCWVVTGREPIYPTTSGIGIGIGTGI